MFFIHHNYHKCKYIINVKLHLFEMKCNIYLCIYLLSFERYNLL